MVRDCQWPHCPLFLPNTRQTGSSNAICETVQGGECLGPVSPSLVPHYYHGPQVGTATLVQFEPPPHPDELAVSQAAGPPVPPVQQGLHRRQVVPHLGTRR